LPVRRADSGSTATRTVQGTPPGRAGTRLRASQELPEGHDGSSPHADSYDDRPGLPADQRQPSGSERCGQRGQQIGHGGDPAAAPGRLIEMTLIGHLRDGAAERRITRSRQAESVRMLTVTREGPFWEAVEGRAPLPPAAVTLGWELVAIDPEEGTIERRQVVVDEELHAVRRSGSSRS
jgi:hypothetical protein